MVSERVELTIIRMHTNYDSISVEVEDENIIIIDFNLDYYITGLDIGSTKIYVYFKDKMYTVDVVVNEYILETPLNINIIGEDKVYVDDSIIWSLELDPNVCYKEIIWYSEDDTIAYVEEGVIYGVSEGKALIYIRIGDLINIKEIEVVRYKVLIEEINIIGNNEVYVDEYIYLEYNIIPEIEYDIDIYGVIVWYSEDENIASIYDGVVKGVNVGEVLIFIKIDDIVSSILINVLEIIDPTIPVIKSINDYVTIGKTMRIDIENYNENDFIFTSSDEVIANFTSARIIRGNKEGVVTISVQSKIDSSIIGYKDIEVTPIPPVLNAYTVNVSIGMEVQIRIDNALSITDKYIHQYNISVNDSSILTHQGNGLFKGIKQGYATVSFELKRNKKVVSELTLKVIDVNSPLDEFKNTLVLLLDDNNDGIITAGSSGKIRILGVSSSNYDQYNITSTKQHFFTVMQDFSYFTTEEGTSSVLVSKKSNVAINGRIDVIVEGSYKMDYIERMLEIADSELGYRPISGWTKFGEWGGFPTGAWCAMFVSWCSYYAGVDIAIIAPYASVTTGRLWFESRGLFKYKASYTPKRGDLIFFLSSGASHTGIVIGYDYSRNRVLTIEGNTSSTVAYREYVYNHNTITGYATPLYNQ